MVDRAKEKRIGDFTTETPKQDEMGAAGWFGRVKQELWTRLSGVLCSGGMWFTP
jgi:hypothetical protein